MGQTTHLNWWTPGFLNHQQFFTAPSLSSLAVRSQTKGFRPACPWMQERIYKSTSTENLGRGDFWMFWSNCSLTKQTCRRWRSFFFFFGGAPSKKRKPTAHVPQKNWLSIKGRSRNLNASWHKVKKSCAEFIHIPKKHVGDHGEIRQKQWHPWRSSAFKAFTNSIHHANQFVKQWFPFTKWRLRVSRFVQKKLHFHSINLYKMGDWVMGCHETSWDSRN